MSAIGVQRRLKWNLSCTTKVSASSSCLTRTLRPVIAQRHTLQDHIHLVASVNSNTLNQLLAAPSQHTNTRSNGLLNKVTFGILGVVTVLASQLTDLGLVASVGGATFGTALVFVYPTIMFLKQQEKPTKESLVCKVIALLGIVMGAVGTKLSFA
mmetsp:Transcript_5866/g.17522  ORF Transcript_5866/g.17522 Transcript_5866/m.17522 type:complete len:155 (+) Transcript_5866:622-1086(+)